ncbi:MAG TPA: GDSL-type esterase/lipase family protein [Opitutaceae bacterium]|nr:GDSL-type esterase/lipase family protein [Opitutaceae bacterium]
MGRVEFSEQRAEMGFPGITVRFVYSGPAPVMRLTGDSQNCFFNLSCNGWDPVVIKLNQGENEIPLPTGIAPRGGWLIELVRRTESWMGTASFDGLLLPAGCELLAPPAWPKRKLMFIGDSLTCGEYNERFPQENDSTPRSTNAARSYGMLLARWLGAQVHLVSCGGRGITRDWSGKRDVNIVPVFFARTLPDKAGSVWDHSRYLPDVIVINDGTDFDAGPQDEATFTDAYAAFVGQVRSAYANAYILLSESGFQSDGSDGRPRTARDQLLRTIREVAERRQRSGDYRIRVVRTGFFPGTPTNGHLVAFQHEQIALDLLGPIREVTGW